MEFPSISYAPYDMDYMTTNINSENIPKWKSGGKTNRKLFTVSSE